MKTNYYDKKYWDSLYNSNDTGWDIGHISTPIKAYIDQIKDKDIKILIPGAGNSYEAEYLWLNGFKNINILDISHEPLQNFKKRVSSFPNAQLIQGDFFSHKESYDLIIEQTFFCALHPEQRESYANKMEELVNENGKMIGLLFDFDLDENGPPYGGSKNEYENLFSDKFSIRTLERSFNSIKPREGKELFFIFEKK